VSSGITNSLLFTSIAVAITVVGSIVVTFLGRKPSNA
jgi:hypothetical protein